MRTLVRFCVLIVSLAVFKPVWAQDLGIVTGSKTGTYIQIGLNIRELVKPHGIDLDVRASAGSIENILAVRHTPGVQMGIVQQDVLAFIKQQAEQNPETRDEMLSLVKTVRLVFPLYNEEVHVLARAGINSFADLEGKNVAIGKKNSGTFLTSVVLFDKIGVTPARTFGYGAAQALEAMRQGEIDAMIYVVGVPAKVFVESLSESDGFHLVPISPSDYPFLVDTYTFSRIPSNTYPWLKENVETVAVKAVLVSYNYRGENCQHLGKLARLVWDGMPDLKQTGHAKWNAVHLSEQIDGWQQYDCVTNALVSAVPQPKQPDASQTGFGSDDMPSALEELIGD